MKINDLISKPDKIHFLVNPNHNFFECVLVKEKGKTFMFHIPHWKFNLNLEIMPVIWHKITGRYIPVEARPDWALDAPIVYIES